MKQQLVMPGSGPAPKLTKNGTHHVDCECYQCTQERLTAYMIRARQLASYGVFPAKEDQVVPVRAHWRRQSNFGSRRPLFRQEVKKVVRGLVKRHKH